MTLLLSRRDLENLLEVDAGLGALHDGFAAESASVPPQRVRTDLPGPGTATALLPGLIEGVPAYTVKVNAKYPDARPALRGVVCLHGLDSGELLALLDSATVTAWRTGLSAALGTHVLARHDASTVAVVGAGAQADLVIRGLAAMRSIGRLVVNDLDPRRAEDFAARNHAALHGVVCDLASHPAAAVRGAGIVVLATWSREPLLRSGDVGPGTHITSLGADEPGKRELAADVLRSGRVIVDDVALAVSTGALGNAGLTAADAAGNLTQVIRAAVPGRRCDDEVTVYAPVGLPWQDLALAWIAYRRALDSRTGVEFDFLS